MTHLPQLHSTDSSFPPPGTLAPPTGWSTVKQIVGAALEQPSERQRAFVADACGADEALRREVESLLSYIDACDELPEPVPASESPIAALLADRYRIERELSGGGMSLVYLAEEISPKRQVVIKVLRPESTHPGSAERFAREVGFIVELQQANIIPVLNVGEVGGYAFYTMPFHPGESLRERISLGAAPTVAEVLGILHDVAKALAFAHAKGIVHRDIKPENVLISGGTAVVTDFGIAKAVRAALEIARPEPTNTPRSTITPSGVAIGTPAYMAPEQVAGDPEVGPPVDIYATGVMAYELLAGAHPFAGRSGREMLAAHVLERPTPLEVRRPDLPPWLTALVMRCLEKDPLDRPADGRALLAALEAIDLFPLGSAGASPRAVVTSVAVLPLKSLSRDPQNDDFSIGVTTEVLFALAHVRGVRVVALTSSLAFKGKQVARQIIGERLGVQTLVEGNVRRVDDRVRIFIQLVNASDGSMLWCERYDRELSDILSVQEEIAQAIVHALERKLESGPGEVLLGPSARARPRTLDPEVSQLYLRGRHLVEQRTSGMFEAMRCFEQAIQLDAGFSGAHAGMSMVLTLFGLFYAQPPRDAFPLAIAAADRALAIDPADVLALVMRAHTALWFEWDFQKAERLARRALDLAPSSHLGYECLGYVLAARGQFEEAITAMKRASTVDPLSHNAAYDLGWVLILAGRWPEAMRELEPAVAAHPQATELRRVYGFCLLYSGRLREALGEFRRVLELNVGDRWASLNLVQALAALGQLDEARAVVREIEQRVVNEPLPQNAIAIMHHWLGDDDTAFAWLDRSIEARDPWLVMAPFDPSLSRLRRDPRFALAMRQVRGITA